MTTRKILTTCLVAGALAGGILAPAAANASGGGGGGGVRNSGTCSAGATWSLKAKHDDSGVLEVEAEVDSNHAGQSWNWSISDNGTRVRAGSATTTAPSGSFTVQRRIADRTGVDHLVFRATRPASGQTCRGTVSV